MKNYDDFFSKVQEPGDVSLYKGFIRNTVLKCIEKNDHGCNECFLISVRGVSDSTLPHYPECQAEYRADNKSVIFVVVEDTEEK